MPCVQTCTFAVLCLVVYYSSCRRESSNGQMYIYTAAYSLLRRRYYLERAITRAIIAEERAATSKETASVPDKTATSAEEGAIMAERAALLLAATFASSKQKLLLTTEPTCMRRELFQLRHKLHWQKTEPLLQREKPLQLSREPL